MSIHNASKSIVKDLTISHAELTKAFNKVRNELTDMGVLYDGTPLDEVECYHDYYDIISGVKNQGYCYPSGNIHIPHLYWAALAGCERDIVEVIRHEFGHAMADRYPQYFSEGQNKIFRKAFGRGYDDKPAVEGGVSNWEDDYVSDYAAKMSREDWAETFMYYMNHKGKIPTYWASSPAIKRKWNAVKAIVKLIADEIV